MQQTFEIILTILCHDSQKSPVAVNCQCQLYATEIMTILEIVMTFCQYYLYATSPCMYSNAEVASSPGILFSPGSVQNS